MSIAVLNTGRIQLIFYLLVLIIASCKKEQTTPVTVAQHPVPSVPVSISIYPNDPTNFALQAIGGWLYFSGGLNGIIVYRKSESEFVALERTSSSLPSISKARACVQVDNFTLLDSISGSKWQIIDGAVIHGPASWPLRLYGTSYDGNLLRVVN